MHGGARPKQGAVTGSLFVAILALVVSLLAFLKGGKSGEDYIYEKRVALRQWWRRRQSHSLSALILDRQARRRESQELYERRKRG